jgi:VWFA-related protein
VVRTLGAGAGLVLLAQALTASAQQDRAQFRGRTDVVRLDVSVLDANRRPVRGLTAADFTVFDNGREYPVVALSEIDLPAPDVLDSSWMHEVASDVESNALETGRLFVIVLDDALMPGVAAHLIRQSKDAAASVIERMGPTDLAAVVFTSDARRSQNFTRDREKLLAVVDTLGPGFFGAQQLGLAADVGGADLAFADEQLMRSSLSTLKQVVDTLIDGPERRKALVYIGMGIALDYSVVTTQIGPGASGFLEGVIFHDVLEYEMDKIFEGAQRANVAVYTIDPTGLDVEPDNLRRDYLETLAANTGGIAVANTNDFEPGVAQIYEENSAYYLLGYEPADPPRAGAFRAIEVRVRRPDVTVRARNGYYGAESDEDDEPVAPVTAALAGLLPATGMPMRVHVAPFPVPGQDAGMLIITAELQQPAPAERVVHEVELVATAYDNDGKHVATKRQTARLVLRPSSSDARYEVLSSLELEPGRYNIRFGGHNDALDLAGSVFYDVEMPELDDRELALSGVLLSVDPAPISAPRDALEGLVPVIPTTQRDFLAYGQASAFVRLYQGRRRDLTPVEVSTTIVDGAGRTVFEASSTIEADRFRASRTADFEFVLPLLDLGPGPHLLIITADGGSDAAPVTRRVRFSVQ